MIADARFLSLKGEFEAEGLSREEVAAEALFAARRGLSYLVKIGGCEARSDVAYLVRLGVGAVVAPMIESAFAMTKYMGIVADCGFGEVGVTIETETAVARIDAILDAGMALTHVTIGRSDLTASCGGGGGDVNGAATTAMVKAVAAAARDRGLTVTMGGSINAATRTLLANDLDLAAALACVETRKVVMPVAAFARPGVLEAAIDLEVELLAMHGGPLRKRLDTGDARLAQIRARL